MSLRAVVLDWDGTVVNSIGPIVKVLQETCRALGYRIPDESSCRRVIGMGWFEIVHTLVPGLSDEQVQAFCDFYSREFWRISGQGSTQAVMPGWPALIERLRSRGVWVGVATGKSRRGLDDALRVTGLTFDATMTASECRSKPHPEMLERLALENGLEVANMVMVGDATVDILMGQAARTKTIAVSWGAGHEDELKRLQPDAWVHTVDEVEQVLQKWGWL